MFLVSAKSPCVCYKLTVLEGTLSSIHAHTGASACLVSRKVPSASMGKGAAAAPCKCTGPSSPTSILKLPWWLLSLLSILSLDAGSQPASTNRCPAQACLLLDAHFLDSVPKGLSVLPQLGKTLGPSLVQGHCLHIRRKGFGEQGCTDLTGHLRLQEHLMGLL